jgi:hypothetical protein
LPGRTSITIISPLVALLNNVFQWQPPNKPMCNTRKNGRHEMPPDGKRHVAGTSKFRPIKNMLDLPGFFNEIDH